METVIRTQRTACVGATTHVEALGTYCAPFAFIASIGQKMQQALTAEKHHRSPRTGGKAPRPVSAYVMLVESDVREGVRGILP